MAWKQANHAMWYLLIYNQTDIKTKASKRNIVRLDEIDHKEVI